MVINRMHLLTGDQFFVEMLLENGAELCATDNEKNMSLHHACINVSKIFYCIIYA